MRHLAYSLVLLAALVFAAPAQAKPHRMTFEFASVVAVDYWAKRGVTIPCRPQLQLFSWREARALQDEYVAAGITNASAQVDMLAYVESCTVGIMPEADAIRHSRDTAFVYCREVIHEIGHLAGLSHEYGGIMDPSGGVAPWGCSHPIKFRRRHR